MKSRIARVTLALLVAYAVGAVLPDAAAPVGPAVAAAKKRSKKARKQMKKVLRKEGLAKLPSVSHALGGGPGALLAAVTGTPPALVDIPDAAIGDVFWAPGVVDAILAGTPTPEQCNQFWSGQQDGDSGGMGACHMAESVGYSVGNVLQGETPLCYMKGLPTQAIIDAGGVTLVSGEFPGGDPTRIFSVPGGEQPRVVRVNVTGDPMGNQSIFLRVASAAQNRDRGNAYEVAIWFCAPGDATAEAEGYNRITIGNDGAFEAVSNESHGGDEEAWLSHVTGFLSYADGEVLWDATRSRRAQVESRHPFGRFKGDVEIRPDQTIATKSYDVGDNWGARKVYVVTSFTGTDSHDLRFLAGAFKERYSQDGTSFDDGFAGATEYRGTYYAAAPGSSLLGELAAVDFDADAFYAAPASPTVDASAYSCAVAPDVEVLLDMANPAVEAVASACESRRFDGMHFCHDDTELLAAQQAYFNACTGHP